MKYRLIQGTDLRVSVIGFGGGRLGSFDGGMTPGGWLRLMEQAFDAGVNLFDTASSYTLGLSERLLGRFLQGRRDEVVVVTKAGYEVHFLWKMVRVFVSKFPGQGAKGLERWARAREILQVFNPECIRRSVERSLRRLGTDYVDLLFLHSVPPEIWHSADTYEVLQRLKEEGKLRYYGFSTDKIEALLARGIPPHVSVVGAVVPSFNVCRNIRLQEVLEELRTDAIVYHPFGAGTLFRAPEGEIEVMREAVNKKTERDCRNTSRAQLAIAYLLSYQRVVSVVPRCSSWQHLSDILQALLLLEA